MNGNIVLNEGKSDRERQMLCDITYLWNLFNEFIYKRETDHCIESKLMVTKGEEGIGLEFRTKDTHYHI